eukprot:TRINITY_DN588_c0_g1_i16.p1 TRINITY_DN588_c0_g1~~TRINITY_DN588_c0_g1_i16.p1  ORF type:complete len:517 (+),score=33.36 TRINITY_DN588_c0_g1_i16:2402-3952(+)
MYSAEHAPFALPVLLHFNKTDPNPRNSAEYIRGPELLLDRHRNDYSLEKGGGQSAFGAFLRHLDTLEYMTVSLENHDGAAMRLDMWIMHLFFQRGLDVTASVFLQTGDTALTFAARIPPSPRYVKALIAQGADVTATVKDGRDSIMYAIQSGSACSEVHEKIEMLVASGGSAQTVDSKGDTALLLAIRRGDCETVVDFLLHHGANTSHVGPNGRTALIEAAAQSNTYSKEWIPSRVSILDQVLKATGDAAAVNTRDTNGMTSLIYAAWSRNPEFLSLVLQHPRVDVDIITNDGYTAITAGAQRCTDAVLFKELLRRTTRVNLRRRDSKQHRTPYLWACHTARLGNTVPLDTFHTLEYINNPNANSVDINGDTCLMLYLGGHRWDLTNVQVSVALDIIRNVSHTADGRALYVAHHNENGETALSYAVKLTVAMIDQCLSRRRPCVPQLVQLRRIIKRLVLYQDRYATIRKDTSVTRRRRQLLADISEAITKIDRTGGPHSSVIEATELIRRDLVSLH